MARLPPPAWGMPCNSFQQFPPPHVFFSVRQPALSPFPHFMPGSRSHEFIPDGHYQGNLYEGQSYQPRAPAHGQNDAGKESYQQSTVWNRPDTSLSTESKPVFSCDACSRDFNSKATLEAHLGSHVKCDQDGCSFIASRKAMKLHFIQVHAEGRMRIKLDTPEEVERWRQERKKKFPTVANVAKKKETEEVRKASGQVLNTRNYSYRGKQHRRNHIGRGARFNRGHSLSQNHHRNNQRCNSNEESNGRNAMCQPNDRRCEVAQHKELLGGDPLSLVLPTNDDNESDTEVPPATHPLSGSKPVLTPPHTSNSSALTALCASYLSSDDDEGQVMEVSNNVQVDEKEVNGTQPTTSNNTLVSTGTRRKRRRRNTGKVVKNMVQNSRRRPTLLEMLLAPEIRHERNAILQCLRYIVKRDFFGVRQTDSSA